MTYPEQHTQNPTLLSAIEPLPLKILLVEDNLTNQKVALKQLQTLGYWAEAVSDGQKAVEAITQSAAAYELVLMDCQMPIMNGYEATQAIRDWESQALEPKNRIIIIAMTASDLPQDRERAIASGMDDFVSKPVRRNALAAVLQRWVQLLLTTQAETDSLSKTIGTHTTEPLHNAFNSDTADSDVMGSKFFQPHPAPDHLDLEHLHLLSDSNPEFELELLQLFVADCTSQLEQLHQAIATQNLCLIKQTAHHIKGASANVGAKVMRVAADQIEIQAYQKQFDAPDTLLPDTLLPDTLLDELATSLQHIKAFVERQHHNAARLI